MSGMGRYLCQVWTDNCVWYGQITVRYGQITVSGMGRYLCQVWTDNCVWYGQIPVSGMDR